VPPYILAQNSCLSPLQQSIIEDKLQAIQLEAPLYVAIMNNTSAGVNGRYVLVSSVILGILLLLVKGILS
jgi:hypothetical protein